MGKVYFVSFASSDIKSSLERIGRQARDFHFFDGIFLYTEKNLPQYAKKRCRQILERTGTRRGYAYWCWKPVIINEVFSKMDEGDILVYSDAGSHMNPNGKQKLENEYIRLALENDIWVVSLEDKFPDVNWTKRDTVSHFRDKMAHNGKLENFDLKLHEGQLEGGTLIAVKNDYTVKIMREWEEYMSLEKLHLFDDSPSFDPEPDSFCGNRHDQSILSLLLKSNHYAATSAEHFYSEDDYTDRGGGWKIIRETEPFMHLRDLSHPEKKESFFCALKEKIRPVFLTPGRKLKKTGAVLLLSLFFLLASSHFFYPLKYLFIKAVEAVVVRRPLNFAHWVHFINTRCFIASLALFFLFLSCKFIEKRKTVYLFPFCMLLSFMASNVFAMKNGFVFGYSNFWDFSDFAIGYGGSGFYGSNYPPLAVGILQLMHTIYPKDASYSTEYARKYLLTLYFVFTVTAMFVLFSKQLGERQKHKNLLAGTFFLTGPLLFAYQRMNIMLLALIFSMIFVLWNKAPERWKRVLSLVSLAVAANIKYFPAIFGLVLVKQKRWKAAVFCFLMGIVFFAFPAFLPERRSAPAVQNSQAEHAGSGAEKRSIPAERIKSTISVTASFSSNPNVLTSVSAEAIAYRIAKKAGVASPQALNVIMKTSLAFFLLLAFAAFFLARNRHTELLLLAMLAILTPISSAWYGLIFLYIPFLELIKKEGFSVVEGIEYTLYNLIFVFVLDERFSFLMPNSSWHVVLLFFVAVFEAIFSSWHKRYGPISIIQPGEYGR